MRYSKRIGLICIGAICAVVITACVLYKPARVLTPELFGLTCPSDIICVEDISTLEQATQLRAKGVAFVAENLAPFKSPPRLLFCSTEKCFKRFGNPKVAALNMGTFGSVINADNWVDYIIRHELIHYLQAEHFGELAKAKTLPRWFIEGMAYALSKDPHQPLPRDDIESWRAKYIAWEAVGNTWDTPPNSTE